jgi:hypothetical protein
MRKIDDTGAALKVTRRIDGQKTARLTAKRNDYGMRDAEAGSIRWKGA